MSEKRKGRRGKRLKSRDVVAYNNKPPPQNNPKPGGGTRCRGS